MENYGEKGAELLSALRSNQQDLADAVWDVSRLTASLLGVAELRPSDPSPEVRLLRLDIAEAQRKMGACLRRAEKNCLWTTKFVEALVRFAVEAQDSLRGASGLRASLEEKQRGIRLLELDKIQLQEQLAQAAEDRALMEKELRHLQRSCDLMGAARIVD